MNDAERAARAAWARVPDFQGQTVYWYRCMGNGFRLVVTRIYEDHQPTGKWSWRVYDDRLPTPSKGRDSGTCSTVGSGKTQAVRAYNDLTLRPDDAR
jgi:hypothetical protein